MQVYILHIRKLLHHLIYNLPKVAFNVSNDGFIFVVYISLFWVGTGLPSDVGGLVWNTLLLNFVESRSFLKFSRIIYLYFILSVRNLQAGMYSAAWTLLLF